MTESRWKVHLSFIDHYSLFIYSYSLTYHSNCQLWTRLFIAHCPSVITYPVLLITYNSKFTRRTDSTFWKEKNILSANSTQNIWELTETANCNLFSLIVQLGIEIPTMSPVIQKSWPVADDVIILESRNIYNAELCL